MTRRIANLLPVLAAAAIVVLAGEALACPNCKATVADASAPGAGDPASAFGYSIYVMIGAVMSIAGGIVYKIVRAAQRSAAATA